MVGSGGRNGEMTEFDYAEFLDCNAFFDGRYCKVIIIMIVQQLMPYLGGIANLV